MNANYNSEQINVAGRVSGLAVQALGTTALPMLIERAASALSQAKSAAEVLEARDMASVAYDAAKKAGRFAKAKQAHDELVAAAHRAQGDALLIEAQAKQRLADEYDAAQERGDVARLGTNQKQLGVLEENTRPATVGEIGLTHKQVHDARLVRDAEIVAPGVVRQTVEEAIAKGEEPTKAKVRGAALVAVSGAKSVKAKGAALARVAVQERKPSLQNRRSFRDVREVLASAVSIAQCLDYTGYEDVPLCDRVTPAAFWEYMTFAGEDQQERRRELQNALGVLEAILAVEPGKPQSARSKKRKPKMAVDGLSVIEQVSAFHMELVSFVADYLANVEAWYAKNPDPCDEAFNCLYNALETSSVRLGQMAQTMDGR
ncbi:hypothetical protein BRDID11004_16230 [Bradyrhizobium diazoefficiens]|uniref:Uncharacterized protein n=1 Tax=Bradyrhizobium diazoefficiens TaxID=1355477 RepID=A0A810AWT1_9BRAD|nr:hypothetical protein [Bradyrhizobium diazoefficiens]BBZ97465.1 hypothetical protein F07S3_72980 [Bradyrhizobium diazoefficiens]BCA15149.1 hypothetical protein BDHF08_69960 [Bradyrhizobium diazoefficiens]BCE59561.1 hypothetical protein XF5B_70730 [Bradyrhizobium diazoefficiens]BCE68244.1 hypothetical protein XF6B_70430 [Bradyrhizobium diazoefficiens]